MLLGRAWSGVFWIPLNFLLPTFSFQARRSSSCAVGLGVVGDRVLVSLSLCLLRGLQSRHFACVLGREMLVGAEHLEMPLHRTQQLLLKCLNKLLDNSCASSL